MIRKVISGGQTGVDRAGLDAAVKAGIPIGGFCPKRRRAEDGVIPEQYPLVETEEEESRFRTEQNVLVADGTLIFNKKELTEGTKLTFEIATVHARPCLVVQLDSREAVAPEGVARWLAGQAIKVLNVAGPRESKHPGGIYAEALEYLDRVFALAKEDP